jgi:hypothetical protein
MTCVNASAAEILIVFFRPPKTTILRRGWVGGLVGADGGWGEGDGRVCGL